VIASSSRRALDEMRRLLQVLRPDAASGELSPVPGLRGLPALAKDMQAAGLRVWLDMEGVPEDPPPVVALTAYRIVQEALTNTLRHGGAGSSADVRVRYGPDDPPESSSVDRPDRRHHDRLRRDMIHSSGVVTLRVNG
jgi:signal transduction histidine kinase